MLNSYYNSTNAQQRLIYEKILSAASGYRESVYLDCTNLAEIASAVEEFIFDHPECYHVALNFYKLQPMATSTRLILQYHDVDESRFENELNRFQTEISIRLNGKEGDYEKCKVVYDYLLETVEYATQAQDDYFEIKRTDPNQQNKTAWENYISRHGLYFVAYGPIVEKRGTCLGLALAYKLLLNRLGIEASCVAATLRTDCNGDVPHTLNVVEVEGRRAFVDLTQGFPAPNLPMIRYDSFLVSRSVVEGYCTPRGNWDCENDDDNFFAKNHVRFDTLHALRNYLYGVSYHATDGKIRFQYLGQARDDYLEKMFGNIISDRCGNEYQIVGFYIQNGIGNCCITRL